jgi:hypothetical protein
MLLYGHLYAFEPESTLKLYHHLLSSMSNKKRVKVYTEDNEYRKIFLKSKYIKIVLNIKDADFILITTDSMIGKLKGEKLSQDTIILTNNYRHMEELDNILGAFYYRKGRRQFLFLKPRLKEHNITLPLEYNKYIVDEL